MTRPLKLVSGGSKKKKKITHVHIAKEMVIIFKHAGKEYSTLDFVGMTK